MDDTFHIHPSSPLAQEAAEEVARYEDDTFVAVRGQLFHDREIVFGVFALDKQDHPSRYIWRYYLAGDWLAEYEKSIAELGI